MNKHLKPLAATATIAAAACMAPSTTAGAAPVADVHHAPSTSRAAAVSAAQAGADGTRQALGLGSTEKLVVKNVITDRDGTQHVRYERTYRGLRVIGGELITHGKPGTSADVTWNAGKKVAVSSTTPRVSAATAASEGQKKAAAAARPSASQGELVVFVARGQAPRLAYEVITTGMRADQTPSRIHTLVDATTGATLRSFDAIKNGSGNGVHVGQVDIGTTQGDGGYVLKDEHGNHTIDMKNAESGGTEFVDEDDTWGDGTAEDPQSAAVDAQYGAGKTFEYFKTQHDRAGIWDDGRGAPSRVHYGDGFANAFWDGSQMTYGDGADNKSPLTAIDVSAHEMSHGVTENTAGLIYSGDPGGLNEATSDIFGTDVEWFAKNAEDPGDYHIGEEIDIRGDGKPLRYMDQPSKDGKSVDCYDSSTGGLNPHYSSGPLNHWFFMASEGSGAKEINGVSYDSPTCGGAPAVTGVGRDKAAKIWYRTLATYLTSSSSYTDARDGAIRSAKDLYADDPTVCTNVAAAFDAITVPEGQQSCGSTATAPRR